MKLNLLNLVFACLYCAFKPFNLDIFCREVVADGRPNKQDIVAEWQRQNPDGKKIDCERETGLSRHTVLKWWRKTEERENN